MRLYGAKQPCSNLQGIFRRLFRVFIAPVNDAALALVLPDIGALLVRDLATVYHQAQPFAQARQFQDDRVIRKLGYPFGPVLVDFVIMAIVYFLGFLRVSAER